MKVEKEKFVTEKQYKNRKLFLSFIKSIGYAFGGLCVMAFTITVLGAIISIACKLFMAGYSYF